MSRRLGSRRVRPMTGVMNGLNSARPAVVAAALASLFVAAPALAKKPEGEKPAPESQARNNNHIKDDKAAGKPTAAAPVAGSPCPDRVFSTVFSAFRDRALYTPAPDGDFEAGASGWELSGGAAVVDESSSILLGEALGARSLELADGGSAVSPEICVERGFPSFRFVTRSADGGVLRVAVLYRDGRKAKKAGRVKARAGWRVTRKVSLAQGRFRVKRGQSASVQLRFTASRGSVRVDDVYIDPRLRR
jgi:hypothetical protein